jgi:hypothetical protein
LKNRGEEGVGWRWEAVLIGGPQLAASGRERRGSWAVLASWAGRGGGPEGKAEKEREESYWAGPRVEGERFRGLMSFVFLFFSKTFQIFSNIQNILKLHTNKQNTMHSNYDAQALIASKLLK